MKSRINRVRKRFNNLNISAFLVTDIVHIRYLTGLKVHEQGDAILLITQAQENYYLITRNLYQEKAQKQIENGKIIIFKTLSERIETIVELLKSQGGKVGFEAENLTVAELQALKEKFSENILLPTENLIEDIASIKDGAEIKKIRKAVEITDHVFQEHLLALIKPGIREIELATEISYLGRKHGAEYDAFEPIVLFGRNSSLPHGQPSNKKLRKGEIIQLDFGYFYQGYCSDMSRVLSLGKPTEKIYRIVLEAQKRAIEAIKPGLKASDLDKIARDFLKTNGFEFIHGLGHGIGIKVHTLPYINTLSNESLKPGQVFTIEPGIYLPGWGGMRVEDDILVTRDGCEILTKSPRELIII